MDGVHNIFHLFRILLFLDTDNHIQIPVLIRSLQIKGTPAGLDFSNPAEYASIPLPSPLLKFRALYDRLGRTTSFLRGFEKLYL
jgi:hypothetical protein